MIRTMQAMDLERVYAIERATQSHPWRFEQFQDSLQQHRCTVIDRDEQVAGFCILQPVLDEANLLLMAIDPQHQRRGLGQRLLVASVQQLPKCQMVFLEVRASNAAAIALYEQIGFHAMDIRRNYYPATGSRGREDALLMGWMLGAF